MSVVCVFFPQVVLYVVLLISRNNYSLILAGGAGIQTNPII